MSLFARLPDLLPRHGFLLKGRKNLGDWNRLLEQALPHVVITENSLSWQVPYRQTQILNDVVGREEFRQFHFGLNHSAVKGYTVMHSPFDFADYEKIRLLLSFLLSGAARAFRIGEDCFYFFPELLCLYLQAPKDERLPHEEKIKREVDRARIAHHDPLLLNTKGMILAGSGDIVEAARCFAHAVQLNPNFAEPFSNMGVLLWDQGKRAEALQMFGRAFVRLPMNRMIADNFRDAALALGDHREMELRLTEAERHYPDYEGLARLRSEMMKVAG